MAREHLIAIELVYALPDEQQVVALTVAAGTTVREAVGLFGPRAHHPGEFEVAQVGIYGRVVPGDTVLREGDRVEIYRPLMMDPKQARRRRIARGS